MDSNADSESPPSQTGADGDVGSTTSRRSKTHPLLGEVESALGAERLTQFKAGFFLPFKSARFLVRNTELIPFVIIPALINIVLFGIAAYFFVGNIGEVVDWLWTKPITDGFLSYLLLALWYVVYVVAILVALLLSYAVVLVTGGLVASPFNDFLSERTERILTGAGEFPEPEGGVAAQILRSVVSSGAIALTYVLIMVPILLLNLIPGVGNAAATILGGAVSAFFLALEFTDPVLERYHFRVRDKFGMIRSHLPLTGSFGFGTSLLLWVPLLNFLCMPIAVIGGTSLAVALKDEEGAPSPKNG
ncbi:MAG: EI24 domain-containing protein [Myxococcota bacterium]